MGRQDTYEDQCAQARSDAESRLINHFANATGDGSIWTLASGCAQCKTATAESSSTPLQFCSTCRTARYCNAECQRQHWPVHKPECQIISTLFEANAFSLIYDQVRISEGILELLQPLQLCRSDPNNTISDQDVVLSQVKTSLRLSDLPPWFSKLNLSHTTAQVQRSLVTLYGILRDEECWRRDCQSFPPSSYTLQPDMPPTCADRPEIIKEFLKLNGHLSLLSIWMQSPQPPAIQSAPFEKRGVYGIIDSLLQVKEIHDAIDTFMETL